MEKVVFSQGKSIKALNLVQRIRRTQNRPPVLLNKFQKFIKKLTDPPHRGKYQAPDSNLKIATKGLDDESRMSVRRQVAKTAMELIWG